MRRGWCAGEKDEHSEGVMGGGSDKGCSNMKEGQEPGTNPLSSCAAVRWGERPHLLHHTSKVMAPRFERLQVNQRVELSF